MAASSPSGVSGKLELASDSNGNYSQRYEDELNRRKQIPMSKPERKWNQDELARKDRVVEKGDADGTMA